MEIKKYNIAVIATAALIAVSILLFRKENQRPQLFESNVYRVVNGWGYDILVNKKLLIRQESIPVLERNQPFSKKQQADSAAALVIRKLQSGQHPSISREELEEIISPYKTMHAEPTP